MVDWVEKQHLRAIWAPSTFEREKVEDPAKYYEYTKYVLGAKDVPQFVREWGGAGVIY